MPAPQTNQRAVARRRLDERLEPAAPLRDLPRPPRGWIRAIRDALGMSGPELARRLGVAPSTAAELEASEAAGRIRLDTLQRAAHALDCDLVYALVPRRSLDDIVDDRARTKVRQHLARIAHHSRLEDQEVPGGLRDDELAELAARLVDRRGLWTDDR